MPQNLIFENLREIIYNPYSIKHHRTMVKLLEKSGKLHESEVFREMTDLKFRKNENNSARDGPETN